MKEFILKNWKDLLLIVLTIMLTIILIKLFRPIEDRSELLKYKLEKLDENIDQLKKIQNQLNDSLSNYKKDIKKIDQNISKIRVEKTIINNYYEQKKDIIEGMGKKEIDSAFKQRYKY